MHSTIRIPKKKSEKKQLHQFLMCILKNHEENIQDYCILALGKCNVHILYHQRQGKSEEKVRDTTQRLFPPLSCTAEIVMIFLMW